MLGMQHLGALAGNMSVQAMGLLGATSVLAFDDSTSLNRQRIHAPPVLTLGHDPLVHLLLVAICCPYALLFGIKQLHCSTAKPLEFQSQALPGS